MSTTRTPASGPLPRPGDVPGPSVPATFRPPSAHGTRHSADDRRRSPAGRPVNTAHRRRQGRRTLTRDVTSTIDAMLICDATSTRDATLPGNSPEYGTDPGWRTCRSRPTTHAYLGNVTGGAWDMPWVRPGQARHIAGARMRPLRHQACSTAPGPCHAGAHTPLLAEAFHAGGWFTAEFAGSPATRRAPIPGPPPQVVTFLRGGLV